MKYIDEFKTKRGFGDGDSLPVDAYHYRTVYVQLFNAAAKFLKKKIRCTAFDRGGSHNSCMVRFSDSEAFRKRGVGDLSDSLVADQISLEGRVSWLDDVASDPDIGEVEFYLSEYADLDRYVWTETTVDTEVLEEKCEQIRKGKKK